MVNLTSREANALLKCIGSYTIDTLRDNPELLSAVNKMLAIAPRAEPWCHLVVTHLEAGNAVNAIKETRAATGLGLKEAKDIIDNVREDMVRRARCTLASGRTAPNPLTEDLMWTYNKIIAALF